MISPAFEKATNRRIALKLGTSQRAIESGLTKVFTKIGVSSRIEALLKSKESGLLSVQEIEYE